MAEGSSSRIPALADIGSEMNAAFRSRYAAYKEANPTFLQQSDWPLVIAMETAMIKKGLLPSFISPAAPQTTTSVSKKSAEGIPMVKEEGVLKIPVELNGTVKLKFVVDSGVADVVISKDVFLTLMRAGTIKKSDFLPARTYVLADGSEVVSQRFIIHSIKVDGFTCTNVEASVGDLKGQLLLGQSFLTKFKEWKIDNTVGQLIFVP